MTREKGTDRAFTGKYWNNKHEGVYRCVCCGTPLFDSSAKYDSGTGWPSFWKPVDEQNVETEATGASGWSATRSSVRPARPSRSRLRRRPSPYRPAYCINSAALKFEEKEPAGKSPEGGTEEGH